MDARNFLGGASQTPPTKPDAPSVGYPTDGDGNQVPPTVPGAFWHYKIGKEGNNMILAAGLVPNDDELDQWAQSFAILAVPAPVGSLLMMDGDVVPAGYLKRNGAALSRTTYANLWAYAQTVVNFTTQATKDGDYEAYAGYYGDGDGSTTFTLPDARGDFPRAWDDTRGIDAARSIGSHQLDTIENITGDFNIRGVDTGVGAIIKSVSGAFTETDFGTSTQRINTENIASDDTAVSFDASNVVRTSSETRPRNTAYLFCVKF